MKKVDDIPRRKRIDIIGFLSTMVVAAVVIYVIFGLHEHLEGFWR